MAYFNSLLSKKIIHLANKAWIIVLLVEKFVILVDFLYFLKDFSKKLAKIFSESIRQNDAFQLKKSKLILYRLIYNIS